MVLCLSATAGAAQSTQSSSSALADLSIEDLANVEITSVSRRAERLADAPASIFVITNDDIRRSGATTLPEALRLAPNLQVARVSARTYAISSRGFNNAIGNKLLVLIDGRTVYTPLYSGVFWDQQDLMLEDVDRIEVISGPGATLWGANAVNGVINVISKRAADTQGTMIVAGGGNFGGGYALRHGMKLGQAGNLRIYAKHLDRNSSSLANGRSLRNGGDQGQIGFRADWGTAQNGFTLQGDAYNGNSEQTSALGQPQISGGNVLARWTKQTASGSDLRFQAYFDHSRRDEVVAFRDMMNVVDLEFQHGFSPREGHRLVWGGGYRQARDDSGRSVLFGFSPQFLKLKWANLFVQDEIQLSRTVSLTLGAKLERNDYTGTEVLPNLRLAWKPDAHQLVWGAVSRAVRAPARIDRDFRIPANPPFFIIRGGPDFISEVANVIELGYRAQPASSFSYSLTAFAAGYDHLRSGQPAPAFVENKMDGRTAGVEAWANWQVTRSWRLNGGVNTLAQHLRVKPGSREPNGPRDLGNNPDYQWQLHSQHSLSDRHELDFMVRHVAALPNPVVPAYTAFDARLGWRASRDLEISVAVLNLFDPGGHPEFDPAATRSEYARSAYLKLRWTF